jgi:hypothetical protein
VIDPDIDPTHVVQAIVDAIRGRLTEFRDHQVVDPYRFGITLGAQFASAILEVANQFLLLGIHRNDRLPVALVGLDLGIDVHELGVPVWMRRAFAGLAVGLQAVTQVLQQFCHQPMAGLVPWQLSSAASLRTLLQVHRRGDSGSPRLTGSTSCSRSRTRVASLATVRLRPPPALRICLTLLAAGSPNSCRPMSMARRETPAARATADTPP